MCKALIIDDSNAMRKIIKQIISKVGFETVEAGDGCQGLEVLEQHSNEIDLVLVDWNMPVMNGLDFVKAVRAQEKYKTKKLVMVTTETEASQMVKALLAGVDEFVMKPFTSEILFEKLRLIGVSFETAPSS